MKILIVEDAPIADDMRDYLMMSGHHCDICRNVDEALDRLIDATTDGAVSYHMLLLDLGLPKTKTGRPVDDAGLEILRHIRNEKLRLGKIVVSADGRLPTMIKALGLEVNIYLTKDVDMALLTLSVENLYRDIFHSDLEKCGNLCFDFPGKTCLVGDRKVGLARKEFRVLEYLYQNRLRVLTHNAIYDYIWEGMERDEHDQHMMVFQYICRIRRKIAEQGGRLNIRTIPGIGYKFTCCSDEAE